MVNSPPRDLLQIEPSSSAGREQGYEPGPRKARTVPTGIYGPTGEREGTENQTGNRPNRRGSRASITSIQPIGLTDDDESKLRRKSRPDGVSKAASDSQTSSDGLAKPYKRQDSTAKPSNEQFVHYEFSYSKAVCDYVRAHKPRRRKRTSYSSPSRNIPLFLPDVTLHHVHKIDLFAIPEEATFIWEPTGAPHWSYSPRLYCPAMGLGVGQDKKSRSSISRDKGGTPDMTGRSRRSSRDAGVKGMRASEIQSEDTTLGVKQTEQGVFTRDDSFKASVRKKSRPSLPTIIDSDEQPQDDYQLLSVSDKNRKLSSQLNSPGNPEGLQDSEQIKQRKIKRKKDVNFTLPALQCARVPEMVATRWVNKEEHSDSSPTPRRASKVPKLPKLT